MANFEELACLLTYIKGSDEVGPKERAQQAFDKYQHGQFLNFRQFQQFMKEVEIDEKAEEIDLFLYKQYFKNNCFTNLLGNCCAKKFRNLRMGQMATRLKKMVEAENQIEVPNPVSFMQVLIACNTVVGGYFQLFDFYADIMVIYVIYKASFMTSDV